MSTTRLTRHTDTLPGAVYNQLQAILQRDPGADRVALLWRDPLQPEVQTRLFGSQAVKLVWCASELAMREALVIHEDPVQKSNEKLVILANLDQSQLGKDVLARLWKNEPQRISPWRTLEQLARVQSIDPRLTRHHRWMAEALLESFNRFQGHIVFGEVLDRETAWQALAWAYLDYKEVKPELSTLLLWSLKDNAERLIETMPESVRDHLDEWLTPELPHMGEVLETLLRLGHAHDLLAVGLACSIMYSSELEDVGDMSLQMIYSGRGRFIERYLDGKKFSPDVLKTFGSEALDTAQSLLHQQGHKKVRASLSQAEQILASLDFMPALCISPVLPGALTQRLNIFAVTLEKALEKGGDTQQVAQVEQSWQHLQAHTLVHETQWHDQMRRAEMALRLLRWLGQGSPSVNGTVSQMLNEYISDGSFVDWARTQLWSGEDHEALARVYSALSGAVNQRREQQNRGFARHLPAIGRGDALPHDLVPVEHALEVVVSPLLDEKKPTLLLVLDGMSEAVYRELQEDLTAYGWIEVSEKADPPPRCLVSALPSATEYSRCSLLSGALGRGNAAQEKQAFAGNSKLRQRLSTRFPPVLLHKQDIQQPGSGGLALEARARIAGTEHKLVGVVINAIDDQLSSSSQVVVHWNLRSTLPMLRQVLEAAREGGRAVVITSDHGHVLDHGTQFSQTQFETLNGERYRVEGAVPSEKEVEVSGPRVLTTSNRAVVPWSEKLRYTKGRNRGYHGGGSLQEVVIPLGIYISASDPAGMPGWSELPRRLPTWWQGEEEGRSVSEAVTDSPIKPAKASRRSSKSTESDPSMPDLFAETQPAETAPDVEDIEAVQARTWIDDLFASSVFEQTFQRAGRVPVTNVQIRRLLELLEQGKGSAMETQVAKHLAIPSIRLRGFLSAVQKILNVDGYPVLKTDRESRTVVLDKESLKLQFEL
ncbi:BREX-2 system phosphatase PglZ [Halomonas titanicae]|uniref:BREX-2 system phosphatase PglZ n=1 Tax=Vreelandella titanicae TaxID=664683 RepID=UPI001F444E59|nr:BREX-2 system phosphatase PglZ [Halomonas titanicae]MCE7517132.1 BREX-2 system phosphatase PglZ [Halomonas titanicae]